MSDVFPAANKKAVIDFGFDGPFGPFAAELSFNDAESTVTSTRRRPAATRPARLPTASGSSCGVKLTASLLFRCKTLTWARSLPE
jgi:hypothetical protein